MDLQEQKRGCLEPLRACSQGRSQWWSLRRCCVCPSLQGPRNTLQGRFNSWPPRIRVEFSQWPIGKEASRTSLPPSPAPWCSHWPSLDKWSQSSFAVPLGTMVFNSSCIWAEQAKENQAHPDWQMPVRARMEEDSHLGRSKHGKEAILANTTVLVL